MTLKAWLKKHGKTVEEFADAIGVAKSSVSRWANGTRFPRPEMIARIQEATGEKVEANDFMRGAV